jgi:hypothetical protein
MTSNLQPELWDLSIPHQPDRCKRGANSSQKFESTTATTAYIGGRIEPSSYGKLLSDSISGRKE